MLETTVRVEFEREVNGVSYVFVTSKDLPGLNLWGPPPQVYRDLIPAIKVLFKRNCGIAVDVAPSEDLASWLDPDGGIDDAVQFCVREAA